jgi:hypothetical protein
MLEQMEREKMLADKKAFRAKTRAKSAETVVLKEAAVRLEEERVTAWDDLDRRFRNLHQVSALKVGTDAMSLLGKTIVFTGTFTMARVDATKAAEAAGAKVGSSVTKNTSILVAWPGVGAKEDDAKAKGVEVWTEDQFIAAIGGGGGAAAAAAAPKGGKQKAASSAEEQEDAPKAKKAKEAPAPKGKQKAAPPAEDMEVEKPPPASPAGNKAQASGSTVVLAWGVNRPISPGGA